MNEIRKERIRDLYIDITCDMIKNEGIKSVTIRSISEKAGYNSATLYSYFNNLSQLIFFAHMKFEDQLLYKFETEINKEKVTNLYDIWPRMYAIMADFYLENPNIFDCVLVNDYASKDNFDVKSQRRKESSFILYVNEKLEMISKETKKDISLIKKINLICLAQVTGTVLLVTKKRQNADEMKNQGSIENNMRKIIKSFMEDN